MHLTRLAGQFFIAALAACMVCVLSGGHQPARAEMDVVVISLPLYGQVSYQDLIIEAEPMVSAEISRQFSQDPNLATVQVVVTGDRHGEIIPVLTTTVSRTQWQADPRVGTWTRYHNSYALIQRHEQVETVALAPTGSTPSQSAPILRTRAAQIDQAFDSGRLTGRSAQDFLSDLD